MCKSVLNKKYNKNKLSDTHSETFSWITLPTNFHMYNIVNISNVLSNIDINNNNTMRDTRNKNIENTSKIKQEYK